MESREAAIARPACDRVVDELDRRLAYQHLRKRLRLCEKEPVIGPHRQPDGEFVPHRVGRHDVEHDQPVDALRMIERHPIADTRAAIMPDDGEAVVAQRLHDGDEVEGHASLRIGFVAGHVGRAARSTVAAQVRHDDGEMAHQFRRHGCHIAWVCG